MTAPTFRLPQGIKCVSNYDKVVVSGPQGQVAFKSSSHVLQKGNIVVFLPSLTPYKASIFTQAVQGVTFGYTLNLSLTGIGYKAKILDGQIVLFLGYSTPIVLTVPSEIFIRINKKNIALTSVNFSKLQNFASSIRGLRFPDAYKGSGVLYLGEAVSCKEGKKT